MIPLAVNREIFSDVAIGLAAQAYKDIAKISIRFQERHAFLVFEDCIYDEVRTAREFENYLIGIENQ